MRQTAGTNIPAGDPALRAERILRELVGIHLKDAGVWLFGSRATGRPNRRSDFDIAYLPDDGFDDGNVVRLREAIEESGVIYRVDLTNLSETSPDFRERVMHEGVRWR